MDTTTQSFVDVPGIKKLRSGKVREVFDLGDTLLFVATDRISAFDVILPDPIPHKGAVLNQISAFWFKRFDTIQNHLLTANFEEFPKELQPFQEQLAGRSMIVKKTKPLPVECVVRGYLAGSSWKEYQESQNVCGIELPAGLKLASQLPEPIFTPATKAEQGHDENIDMRQCAQILGDETQNLRWCPGQPRQRQAETLETRRQAGPYLAALRIAGFAPDRDLLARARATEAEPRALIQAADADARAGDRDHRQGNRTPLSDSIMRPVYSNADP